MLWFVAYNSSESNTTTKYLIYVTEKTKWLLAVSNEIIMLIIIKCHCKVYV